MIGDIRKFRFWCQKVLPLVYDNSLSYYEVLCRVIKYLNNVIEDVNSIPEYIDGVITERLSDEHIKEILSEFIAQIESALTSNNEGTNTNSSKDYKIGQLLWLNGNLYKVIRDIDAGDTFIVDTNIQSVNFEDLYNTFIDNVKHDISANDDGERSTASQNWTAGQWIWLNDVLYEITNDIIEGNSYVFSGDNANVKQITVEEMAAKNKTAISNEVQARTNADQQLANNIDTVNTNLDNEVTNRSRRDWKTIYDYGYTTGSNITTYIQAFLDDANAKEIYLYMDGSYTINSVTIPNNTFKHFYKSGNCALSGAGASQLKIENYNAEGESKINTSSTIANAYTRTIRNTTNAESPVTGNTIMNLMCWDDVDNENDGFYHWNICAISNLHTKAQGENCAAYLQVNNYQETKNWGLAIEVINQNTNISNRTSMMRGAEIKLIGNGGTPGNDGRVVLHLTTDTNGSGFGIDSFMVLNTGISNITNGANYGIKFGQGVYGHGIYFDSGSHSVYGIDFADAGAIDAAAIRVGTGGGHIIQFDDYTIGEKSELNLDGFTIHRLSTDKYLNFLVDSSDATPLVDPTTVSEYLTVRYNGKYYGIPMFERSTP